MKKNLERLKRIISEKFGVPPEEITPEADLTSDLNMTGLEISDLVGLVTAEFELVIPERERVDKIAAVSDILNLIDVYSEEL